MSYWDDIEKYENGQQARLIEYIDKKHKHKMKELEKEVELFKLQKEAKKHE